MLHTMDLNSWQDRISLEHQQQSLDAIEAGKVLFLPMLGFELLPHEKKYLCADFANPKNKNISLFAKTQNMQGAICSQTDVNPLREMMARYASSANILLQNLLPTYTCLEQARTSYRPVEIAGRKALSYRKDDTRLHVDAFPSTPMQGKRILRVFTNVNPTGQPRVWRIGAPFSDVVGYFSSQLKKPRLGSALLLKTLKVTKTKRTTYDHYMLQLHNAMKADLDYQKQVQQITFQFPANSTWIVYTDQVSHAAMSGQFVFEQSFYVPHHTLSAKESSPLNILESYLQEKLL